MFPLVVKQGLLEILYFPMIPTTFDDSAPLITIINYYITVNTIDRC
jgi:hypothetical protein